jgi:HEAT repeat protein
MLRDLMRDYPNDPEKIIALVRAMGSLAVEHLILSLHDEDPIQRTTAAQLLALLGDCSAVPALIDALNVRGLLIQQVTARQRREASDCIFASGRVYSPYTRGAISSALEQFLTDVGASLVMDAVANVRTHCAFALGMLGDSRAIEPLSALLTDRNESVRDAARLAIDWIRSRQADTNPSDFPAAQE